MNCLTNSPHRRCSIPYICPPMTPQTTLRQSRLAGGPAHRPPYLCLYFPLVNTRPVPLLSGCLPLVLHDIMPRMGHTPLSFHSLSGTTQLANPYFGVLFLQSHYLMGPCCGKHLSSLLWAISSEPYSLLHLLWVFSLWPSSWGTTMQTHSLHCGFLIGTHSHWAWPFATILAAYITSASSL
jgi:hypothetical protein